VPDRRWWDSVAVEDSPDRRGADPVAGFTAEGEEFDATPGQVTALPAGHDAWVVGDEPVVVVDWWGASNYARSDSGARVDTARSGS
jgi:hypothetical protein